MQTMSQIISERPVPCRGTLPTLRAVRLRNGRTRFLCCEEAFRPPDVHAHLDETHDIETVQERNRLIVQALHAGRIRLRIHPAC